MHSGLPALTESGSLKDGLAEVRPPPQNGELLVGFVGPHSFVPHRGEVSSFSQKKKCQTLPGDLPKKSTELQP